jgi:hypothetical protein
MDELLRTIGFSTTCSVAEVLETLIILFQLTESVSGLSCAITFDPGTIKLMHAINIPFVIKTLSTVIGFIFLCLFKFKYTNLEK